VLSQKKFNDFYTWKGGLIFNPFGLVRALTLPLTLWWVFQFQVAFYYTNVLGEHLWDEHQTIHKEMSNFFLVYFEDYFRSKCGVGSSTSWRNLTPTYQSTIQNYKRHPFYFLYSLLFLSHLKWVDLRKIQGSFCRGRVRYLYTILQLLIACTWPISLVVGAPKSWKGLQMDPFLVPQPLSLQTPMPCLLVELVGATKFKLLSFPWTNFNRLQSTRRRFLLHLKGNSSSSQWFLRKDLM
jgi:hypothetical protein